MAAEALLLPYPTPRVSRTQPELLAWISPKWGLGYERVTKMAQRHTPIPHIHASTERPEHTPIPLTSCYIT